MQYFSVDRRGVYVEGQDMVLALNNDPKGNKIVAHINDMYPAGFSPHGVLYFRDPGSNSTPEEYRCGVLELLLEATRKAHYPNKPCRYQSMFATDSVEAALQFRAKHGKPEHPIHELQLHPQPYIHRGDMGVYALGQTFASIDHRLHLYWQGKTLDIPGHQPQWEFVLPLPVRVGEKVA